ncbi:MAG: hypothetical protein ACOVVK_12855 [Elsteraceae bacterium]
MTSIADLADLFQAGDLAGLGHGLGAVADRTGLPLDELAYDVYATLHARQDGPGALNFILAYSGTQQDPAAKLRSLALRIHNESDRASGANLLMNLIASGAGEPIDFETCIAFCVDENHPALALSTFEQFRARFGLEAMSKRTRFNIGSLLVVEKRIDEAFALFKAALELDPDLAAARANILHLARGENHPGAIAYIERQSAAIAAATPVGAPLPEGAAAPPYRVLWSGVETEAIARAIQVHGFCHVKRACSLAVVAELRAHMETLHQQGFDFPIMLSEEARQAVGQVFLFDPKAVLRLLSLPDLQIDPNVSAMRRVSLEGVRNVTPFHQDSTAFQRLLYNTWIPLTPAGGDYPSIQFVAKMINVAEQTRLFEGEFNGVEIDADFVMRKYGDLLRTVDDADPGDCVMFCGTTIHRSHGLDVAIHPRFNIEVRWS